MATKDIESGPGLQTSLCKQFGEIGNFVHSPTSDVISTDGVETVLSHLAKRFLSVNMCDGQALQLKKLLLVCYNVPV